MQNTAFLFGFTWQTREIFLPLGISFFTFQQIAWLVDSYRLPLLNKLPPSASLTPPSEREAFIDYALFVSFFPQLIAGPIVHHGQIIPQFHNKRTYIMNWRNIAIGLSLLSLGLFKKVVIADTLSPWVADGFDNTDALTFIEAWGAALSYTFQIYFDFSGYSDMAMGLGKLFNIDIPINFNSPYKATSIIDFWRRWHITLSQFLRDYVYIPLGGNRGGEGRRYANLMLTMLIGGLWHGAAWQFVFWGFLHGFYLCVNNMWKTASRRLNFALPKIIGWLVTFTSVVFAWVFFRAASFERALSIIAGMCGWNGVFVPDAYLPIKSLKIAFGAMGGRVGEIWDSWHFAGMREALFLVFLAIFVLVMNNSKEWTEKRLNSAPSVYVSAITGIAFFLAVRGIIGAAAYSEFLYFNF